MRAEKGQVSIPSHYPPSTTTPSQSGDEDLRTAVIMLWPLLPFEAEGVFPPFLEQLGMVGWICDSGCDFGSVFARELSFPRFHCFWGLTVKGVEV